MHWDGLADGDHGRGDDDTSDSYAFAEPAISKITRACVYDPANLGRSDPAPGPRGLAELVGDLEQLLRAAKIPGPYVLVGTSGGGYISAGYAYAHPRQVAGIVFVEVPAPFRNPPREIVEDTDPDNPANVEKRDYLQVEKDAWNARTRIGDIPVTIITDEPSGRYDQLPLSDALQALGDRRRCQSSVMTTLPLARPCSTYASASRVWSNGNALSMSGRRWPAS